jgi:hypothetical protein
MFSYVFTPLLFLDSRSSDSSTFKVSAVQVAVIITNLKIEVNYTKVGFFRAEPSPAKRIEGLLGLFIIGFDF